LAHSGIIEERIENVFYWLAIPLGGYHWAREGLEALVEERSVGIELLMLAATAGSAILGLWDEAALVCLYGAAEGAEEYTYARTRRAIRALLDLAPKETRVLRDGKEEAVSAASLAPGDVFVVRPGEALPTDGIIESGASSLDESPVTGDRARLQPGGPRGFGAPSVLAARLRRGLGGMVAARRRAPGGRRALRPATFQRIGNYLKTKRSPVRRDQQAVGLGETRNPPWKYTPLSSGIWANWSAEARDRRVSREKTGRSFMRASFGDGGPARRGPPSLLGSRQPGIRLTRRAAGCFPSPAASDSVL
jgi:E1-E2 ATPase